jgi:outer membrane protein TolC
VDGAVKRHTRFWGLAACLLAAAAQEVPAAAPQPSVPGTELPVSASRAAEGNVPLFAGQVFQPIDLAGALRLAGARDVDIATARQRMLQAVAELEQARALWLPSLFIGPTWYRADGHIQDITGRVITADRSSLFLGGTAALANGFPAPSPGTGYPQLTGLSSVLRISDAIFEPLAAKRVAAANQAAVQATANNALLAAAEAYFNLQLAAGGMAIAQEAAGNADQLAQITGAYTHTGQGLEADHRRALAELRGRQKLVRGAVGQVKVASAQLIRQLVLDPHLVVAPIEPAEAIVHLVPDEIPLDCLIAEGLHHRPELAQAQATVEATLFRLKQAKLRPFVPSLAVTYAGGGFGGGVNAFFGNFGARGDAAASLFWELHNLGFTDRAIVHRRQAEHGAADIDVIRVQAQVAADVVASYETRAAAANQMAEARQAVIEAIQSLELNFTNIRRGAGLPGATRPIEVLQPIQALAAARLDYLESVLAYNRAQFRLVRALGQPPALNPPPSSPLSPPPLPPCPPAPARAR